MRRHYSEVYIYIMHGCLVPYLNRNIACSLQQLHYFHIHTFVKESSYEMVFSSLFSKRSRYELGPLIRRSYEITEIESINIEPDFLVPALSLGSNCREKRNGSFTPPGCIEEGTKVPDWTESLISCEEMKDTPSFNLLPNGRKKKSFRIKIKNSFNKNLNFRRATYALDSRSTSLGDRFTASSKKFKTFVRDTMERLRPTEATWADFDDLFSGTNPHFIPFMNINHMTRI